MSQPDPCSVVRIAIALAAVTHKPRHQSTPSYLLDLQSRFPLATKDNDSREWRTYALELEKQIATLKAQHDADQELLSKLPTDASLATSTSDAPPPKKKSKKNPTKDQHDPGWSWDQSRADWSRFLLSQYPSSPSLVAAYASLKGILASPNAVLLSHPSRLTDAILRALDTIRVFLFSAPNPSPNPDPHTHTALGAPFQINPQHIDSARIAMTSPLLVYLLRTAFPALLRTAQGDNTKSKRQRQRIHPTTVTSTDAHAHVDNVLNHLLECVLLPLVRALTPLCFARLAPLVTPSPKKPGRPVGKGKRKDKDKDKRADATSVHAPKNTDTRTDVFALIGTSLEALDALPHLARPPGPGGCRVGTIPVDIRNRLGLETICELEALYAVPPPPSSSELSSESHQPLVTPSEAPPLPTPNPTPLSAQSQSQPQPRTQQRTVAESRAKRLERLAGTRADRVRALATRDAGWFLASTLNLCVTPPPPPPPAGGPGSSSHCELVAGTAEHAGGLLGEALLDRIGKLVRSVPVPSGGCGCVPDDARDDDIDHTHTDCTVADTSKRAIDPVCQNMLLAICERTMTQLAPCS